MTYRIYLVVLVAVVGVAQLTAALQRSLANRQALFAAVAAEPAPAPRTHLAPTLAAAGGVSRQPPSALALAPSRVSHDAPCDTVSTTADTCVAPAPSFGPPASEAAPAPEAWISPDDLDAAGW